MAHVALVTCRTGEGAHLAGVYQRQPYRKGGPLTLTSTLRVHAATVAFDEIAHNGEAQAKPPVDPVCRAVRLAKTVEHILLEQRQADGEGTALSLRRGVYHRDTKSPTAFASIPRQDRLFPRPQRAPRYGSNPAVSVVAVPTGAKTSLSYEC